MTRRFTIQTSDKRKWFEPLPGQRIAICVHGKETNGSSALIEGIMAPQSFTPLHVHHYEDELLRVLDGTLDLVIENEELEAAPGSVLFVPRGTAHGWSNFGNRDAHIMAMLVPGGFELFFEEMLGRPISDMPEIAARHGCEVFTR
jgi:mannose-6-phosphate isomerase-like protein (cupin superfamily)